MSEKRRLTPGRIGLAAAVITGVFLLVFVALRFGPYRDLRRRYRQNRAKTIPQIKKKIEALAQKKQKEQSVRYNKDIARLEVKLADHYMEAKKWHEAAAALKRAVRLDDTKAQYYAQLGRTLYYLCGKVPAEQKSGLVREALAAYHRAVDLGDASKKVKYGLGMLHFYHNQEDPRNAQRAIEYMRDAVLADPEFSEAHIRLGQFYWSVREYNNSLKHLNLARNLLKEQGHTKKAAQIGNMISQVRQGAGGR